MNQAAAKLSGIVLAGGKSSRFGRDKSRMDVGGKKVLDHLAQVLGAFPFQAIAVVTAKERESEWPERMTVLHDDQEGLGPIGGVVTALRHFPCGALVVACDMPFVTVSMVEWLLGHHDADADATVPRHAAGIEPLFAIYEKSLLRKLDEAIGLGRYALHGVLEIANIKRVDVPKRFSVEREFANINTPGDYERALKLL